MRNNLWRCASVVAVLLALGITGCSYWEDATDDAVASPKTGEGRAGILYDGEDTDAISVTETIWAGQTIDVGTVQVWNDHDQLYVKYVTTGNWYLTETHVAVATTLSGIPQRNGNPQPGQFPYSAIHEPPIQETTYTIDLSAGWRYVELYIATHCVVKEIVEDSVIQQQTGWAGPEEFPGKNWAKYFRYRVKKVPLLPPQCFTVRGWHDFNTHYWRFVLSNVPDGYDVDDGTYYGWCVEYGVFLQQGYPYHPVLYSSYDPNLPSRLQDPDWDMVNYIINHRQGTHRDVTEAIWYFIGNHEGTTRPLALAMIQDALAHGEGFYPGAGQLLAIIADFGEGVQLCFLEIDP